MKKKNVVCTVKEEDRVICHKKAIDYCLNDINDDGRLETISNVVQEIWHQERENSLAMNRQAGGAE